MTWELPKRLRRQFELTPDSESQWPILSADYTPTAERLWQRFRRLVGLHQGPLRPLLFRYAEHFRLLLRFSGVRP